MPLLRSALWTGDPTVKPPFGAAEIDWGHPLAAGVGLLCLFSEGGGAPYNLVNGQALVPTGAVAWTTLSGGLARQQVTAGTYDTATWAAPRSNTYSLFVLGQIASNTGAVHAALDDDPATRVFQFRLDTTPTPQFLPFDTGGTPYTATGTTTVALNTNFSLGATLDSGKLATIYYNGKAEGTALGANTMATPNATVAILSRAAGSSDWAGSLYVAYGWPSRTLEANALLWLHAEPYAMLRPIVRRRYSIPAGGITVPEEIAAIEQQSASVGWGRSWV